MVFGVCPSETLLQWVLTCSPKGLNNSHIFEIYDANIYIFAKKTNEKIVKKR